jgi:hypothetical protein
MRKATDVPVMTLQPKLHVEFDEPSDGWLAITLRGNGREFSETFSHIYPTLRDLCGALCDVLAGHDARRVAFLLEPRELELCLAPAGNGRCRLSLSSFADRRRSSGLGAVAFEFEGDAAEIVLPFWRALRRLQTTLTEAEFEARWRDPFPNPEMASLTELVKRTSPAAKTGARLASELRRCPCCFCKTLGERGGFEICPVCFWEDDGQDDHDAEVVRGGPNGVLSLTDARANYRQLGACDERSVAHVRPPTADELPDEHSA